MTADVDALFLPANNFTGANITFIKTWFDLGGKLLWVGGDSDFAGQFLAGDLNPVLEEVGSVLRLDAGAVDDPVNNDGISYRVVANQLGNGSIYAAIKEHVNGTFAMSFHGPASVYYMKDGAPADLRNANLENVEVVVKSSLYAVALDEDLSADSGDFYNGINANGNLPLIAVETLDNNVVVVSGEAVFKDFKNMYGNTLEYTRGFHYGSIVVDTIISYIFANVIMEPTNSMSDLNSTTPFNSPSDISALDLPVVVVSIGLGLLVVGSRRKSYFSKQNQD